MIDPDPRDVVFLAARLLAAPFALVGARGPVDPDVRRVARERLVRARAVLRSRPRAWAQLARRFGGTLELSRLMAAAKAATA